MAALTRSTSRPGVTFVSTIRPRLTLTRRLPTRTVAEGAAPRSRMVTRPVERSNRTETPRVAALVVSRIGGPVMKGAGMAIVDGAALTGGVTTGAAGAGGGYGNPVSAVMAAVI